MRSILVTMTLLVSATMNAQDGVVITTKGDTLSGRIQIMSYDLMDRVQVKSDGKKSIFTAVQVKTLILKEKRYAPVKMDNSFRFMEVIKTGYLSLYGFRQQGQSTYDGRMMVKMGGQSQELPNIGFKKFLANFLEDCPDAAAKVENGELGRSEIEKVVDAYNECIDSRTAATQPKSTTPPSNPISAAAFELRTQVEASSVESKKDIVDLLNNISDKASKNETIPSYLKEGLKSYLSGKKEFEPGLEKLNALLN